MFERFTQGSVYRNGVLEKSDIAFSQGRIIPLSSLPQTGSVIVSPLEGKLIVPGLVDVHVHLREPGFSYKETIRTGTMAAARGGYTGICAMPNLNPVPDSLLHILLQQRMIDEGACVRVYPYASITLEQKGRGELVDFEALAPYAIGFSDDGRGVQNESIMREAMRRVKAVNGILVAHCEEDSLLQGGYIHDGEYARMHGHKGICSESEWRQVQRDIQLAKETGCRYHICHVSTKESVALVRRAKAEGLDVSCETAPHYLLMNDSQLQEDGRFKMNPPIRSQADQEALIEGLVDGTIEMVATDHAPHSAEEKSRGLKGSVMGVVGLECAFAALYTGLVKPGILPLEKLICTMTDAPRRRFRLPQVSLEPGDPADLTVFDLSQSYSINPEEFASMGHATPLSGMEVWGPCDKTIVGGETVWQRN